MKGFFSLTNSSTSQIDRRFTCVTCGLYKNVLSPRMKPSGKGKKGILIIGEAPGEWEDRRGRQWQGRVGRALKRALSSFGIDLFRDCKCINAVNCRPPNNATPTSFQIQCCRSKVWRVIEEFKPKLILLLGGAAIESFLADRWKKRLGGIGKWRGWKIPDRDVRAWVCPTFHPSYIERSSKKDSTVPLIWAKDLEQSLDLLDVPFPNFEKEEDCVECITDFRRVREFISDVRKRKALVAFDYETTGLKPHKRGHRVVCISVSDDEDHCLSFPVSKEIKGTFRRFLKDGKLKKIAQNMKFEDTWSRFYFRTKVNGWIWDTMLASHVLDNRAEITGLKFQVYVNFGIIDYDSSVSKYLNSNSKDANAFNRIDECPVDDLLLYCGLDSLFERKLAIRQMKELNYDPK